MNTAAAALEAQVTAATIRTWCRRGVIAATKHASRWIIDTASLAHRIAIAAMRTRKAPVTKYPIRVTGHTRKIPGSIGAVGPADTLKAAFEAGQPLTLSGKFAGETVYLGHTRQTYGDYGITLETIGLDYALGETPDLPGVQGAVYLIDQTRLDAAPRLAAVIQAERERTDAAAFEAERRAAEEERRYLDSDYD
jgi:hypothetical protein